MTRASVCFVSETAQTARPSRDPSTRYRCHHPAERLAAMGCAVTVTSAEAFLAAPDPDHDAYVFHRPSVGRPGFARTLDGLRDMGRVLVADWDDLLFGTPAQRAGRAGASARRLPPDVADRAFADHLAALDHFDRVAVSSASLRAAVTARLPGARVRIAPNFIPPALQRIHAVAGTARRGRPPGQIGYFAGTRTHDRDLAAIRAPLHRALAEDPDLHLLVVGPVALPRSLAVLDRVRVAPAVDYLALPRLMSLCTTVLAPLEDTEFNACKSRVKFLEAALAGCRLVASPISDMATLGPDHIVVARTPQDWYDALRHVPGPGALATLRTRNLRQIEDHADIGVLADLIGV